jgi:membrane protease YdiL (CAAX protease family)
VTADTSPDSSPDPSPDAPPAAPGGSPLERYVAPAAGRSGFWRVIVGIVLILVTWFAWTVVVMSVYVLWQIASGMPVRPALQSLGDMIEAGGPVSVLFQLATFAGIWPGIYIVVRGLHDQPFGTLFSPEARIRWGEFGGGLLLAAAFSAATLVLALVVVGIPERTALAPSTWLVAMIPLVPLVFLQASGEEMIFRGYLLQQLALRLRTPLVWAVVPAVLFGFAHYSGGTALGIGWHYVLVTATFGLAAAALVWRTGSLAAAMGLHTGMNVFAISGIGVKGVLEGNQLWLYEPGEAAALFTVDGIATFLILIFILSPLCPFGPRRAVAREAG